MFGVAAAQSGGIQPAAPAPQQAPQPPPAYDQRTPGAYYRSVDGSLVHRPTKEAGDFGHVTAVCADGSNSFSHSHRGTCSHHGGVAEWK
jgi:hypothetical protein